MRWIAPLAWIALLTTSSACCTPRLPVPVLTGFECVDSLHCEEAVGSEPVVITIDAAGNVSPECIAIDPMKNRVTWSAKSGFQLDQLRIRFKEPVRGRRAPEDPLCSGPLCFMNEPTVRPDDGLFCYAVVYRAKGGEARAIDPKLIIKH